MGPPSDFVERLDVHVSGALAHSLRQPLSVAWGYLELILDESEAPIDQTTRAYLRHMRLAMREMDGIVERITEGSIPATRPYGGGGHIVDLDASARTQAA